MTYNTLLTNYADGILTVTINREQAMNALNKETFKELKQLFGTDANSLEGLLGVIITGAGAKAFVAGADIKEFDGLDKQSATELSRRGQEIFNMIENFHRPVIAAVNGFALGGGCELAMACHMRIAGEKARFGQPEVKLGLIPGYAGTQRLTRYIGKAKSMEFHMTGDMIGAEDALSLGLVNYVVPQGEEVAKAKELLDKIKKNAPLAISKIIKTINAYYDKTEDGFKREYYEFGNCVETDDFVEGTTAFVEKRTPNFTGK
ncbi:MAG: enoyl-CoA hydratase-related protein [Bacteroidota bacterium]